MPVQSQEARAGSVPSFSVLICAYTMDRVDVLDEAIRSIREQTLAAQEIVLVIDNCPELLDAARERWPGAHVIPNRQSQGLSGARNTGVAEASGEVVAFLDDDAIAMPDWLETLARAYADPEVLGAGGTVTPRWVAGRPSWFPPEFDWVVGCTHSGMPAAREPVRNLVGANMSLRRRVLDELGGFRRELGRVGTLPVGCEETDLCIRVAKRWPESLIVYDPAATVEHVVPPQRGTFRYFRERCAAEGRSKAVLANLLGAEAGLSEERTYTRRTLPLGVGRGLADTVRGRPAGLARAGAICFGLARTTIGYLGGRGMARGSVTGHEDEGGDDLERTRVLMVTPRSPLGQGGVERHVLEVSRRMVAAGVEVEVLCADPDARGVEETESEGVPIRTVRGHPRGRDYYFAPRIWREISRRGPWDVIHVQSYHTLVAPLAMLKALRLGVPYVVTFHGGGHSSDLRNRARSLQMRMLRPLLGRAARLVAVARFEISEYGDLLDVPADRFVLIPNGTDPAFGAAGANGEGEPATLATIGRLERYKGQHRVLEAFPHVLAQKPDACLLVIGKGPYESELREQADRLGVRERVEFTSIPPEDPASMAALLGRVSLVVLLSEFETHPLVAIEAAAAHRRLLVSDSGGLGELADDGYARGIPYDESPTEIATAIVEELGKPAPRKVPPVISWDECAARLLELYRSI